MDRANGVKAAARAVALLLLLALAAPRLAANASPAAGDEGAARFGAAAAKVLARKELDGATVGIDVRSLTRGMRWWSRGAAQGLAPASNLKVVTLCLALQTLGRDYQFETPLLADGPVVEGGKLDGDLWIRGCGDPTLQPCFFESEDDGAALQPFVQALALQGVKSIRGDLVVDARAFDDDFLPDGWPKDQLGESYCAPVSALSLNNNVVRVRVVALPEGGFETDLRPPVAGWSIAAELSAAKERDAFKIGLSPPDARGVVRIRGSVGRDVGGAFVETTVPDPPDFFGRALRAALERAGIAVGGQVRAPAADEKLSEKARVLYTRRSPLLPALQLCGKESNNHIAEQLLKACALARYGKGTVENGARLVAELARDVGVADGTLRIVDGSGLSRDDVVTAELVTAVLARAYAAPWRDDFLRCLPISGVDGTLDRRMNEPAMTWRVRAKTGFIARVSALSGYAMAGEGDGAEVFAFSILINGFKGGNAEMKKVQDDLCRALIGARPE